MEQEKPYSVSEFIEVLNEALKELSAEVMGEVTEMKASARGHVYFVLKDKETGHVLPCTIWKSTYDLNGLDMEEGMEIVVKGRPEFYAPFGKLSFIVKAAELVGEGALKKAYEKLKKKLTEEGLFEISRKRPLPLYPEKIGVITSIQGAVIHDFSNNLRKSGFKVKILDCRVEGPESGRNLTLSLRAFRKEDVDVVVLIRGGGSMQSLAGFDNEALVREIAKFPVPVITGIGHHQDEPLAALVADAATSTPSFAAAMLNRSWEEAAQNLRESGQKVFAIFSYSIKDKGSMLDHYYSRIRNFLDNIFARFAKARDILRNLLSRLRVEILRTRKEVRSDGASIVRLFSGGIKKAKTEYLVGGPKLIRSVFSIGLKELDLRLGSLERVMLASNPERQLKLGYSIALSQGRVVRSVKSLSVGGRLEVRVSDGSVTSLIEDVK